eukprot:SAG25_NODE_439_length_7992_cov_12.738376_11_plen_172_part_00
MTNRDFLPRPHTRPHPAPKAPRRAAPPPPAVPPAVHRDTAGSRPALHAGADRLVLLKCSLHATCVLTPLARMMQASEQALVNEGLEEGREEKVCFDVGGRSCWCRVPAEAATTLCDGELCWTPWAGLFSDRSISQSDYRSILLKYATVTRSISDTPSVGGSSWRTITRNHP